MAPKAKRKSQPITKRQSDILNKKVYGDEPIYTGPIDKITMINAVNWYSTMLDVNDSQKFLVEYYQKSNPKLSVQIKKMSNIYDIKSYGWLVRLISNGATVDDATLKRIDKTVTEFVKKSVQLKQTTKNVIKIQDKIKSRLDDIIGDIESMIDNDGSAGVYDFLKNNNIPALYGSKIIEFYSPVLAELKAVAATKDPQLKEGYKYYTAKQIKQLVATYESIISQINKFADNTKKQRVRKPRAKKEVSATKKASSLQYLKDYADLKIVSVDPSSIVGASEVWLFNTTNSTLTKLVSNSTNGLDIKGTSILNVDIENSISKRVGRKAQEVVDVVLKGGKIKIKKVFDMVSAKATTPTNRTNSATVILKVVK